MTSKREWTAGPWSTHLTEDGESWPITYDGGGELARVFVDGAPNAAEADAHLIAAAPDLYKAAVTASEALAFFSSVIKSGEPWSLACELMRDKANNAIRAALSRASGLPDGEPS